MGKCVIRQFSWEMVMTSASRSAMAVLILFVLKFGCKKTGCDEEIVPSCFQRGEVAIKLIQQQCVAVHLPDQSNSIRAWSQHLRLVPPSTFSTLLAETLELLTGQEDGTAEVLA
jgi:hypothetical protein